MGYDTCYAAYIDEQMIGCVILSDIGKIEDKNTQDPLFLHALVVDKNFRNKGVASNLLSHVNSLHKSTICFASGELKQLYFSNEFTMRQSDELTEPFKSRYINYKNKQPDLFIFHRGKG